MLHSAAGIRAQDLAARTDLPSVLFLADHLGYSSGVSHGLTSYLLNVLPALAGAGVDLTVCFLRESHVAADVLRGHGIEPIFLNAGKLDPRVALNVASIARQRGCRILHATQMKATLIARIVAPLVEARTIIHVHDLNRVHPAVRALQRAFARPSDRGLCVADVIHGLAASDYALRRDRISTLHNSLPLERFRQVPAAARDRLRAEFAIAEDAPVLGMIGRMFPVKGHRHMLSMMAQIVRRHPDAILLLVGDGPERASCEALIARLGLGANVVFAGQRSDVPDLLTLCSLVVLPSESEGLPLTAIEAMAAARPVVGFDVGGMREVVDDGRTGRLVAAGDSAAFIAAVLDLLDDPAELAAAGAAAAAAAERFGIEHHVRRLLSLYREIGGGRRAGDRPAQTGG
ncbi:MAG: glycosyltransferase [Gammaproteobacteria bacterium]|nr:glycosyltransferase [Gammaproteobacteria bacterium]